MPKRFVPKLATSQRTRLFIQDSTSTSGAGLAGLTATSSGLSAYYHLAGAGTTVAIPLVAGTLGTYVNSGGAGTGGGFIAVDSFGLYEICLPDAMLAGGEPILVLRGATNMVPNLSEYQLTGADFSATLGGANALLAFGAGTGQINPTAGAVPATVAGPVGSVTGNVGGNLVGSVGSVTAPVTVGTNNDKLGYGLSTGERNSLSGVILSDTSDTLGADIVALGTNLTAVFNRIGAPAGASIAADIATRAASTQIPANFTSALFASAGVFATAALANAPTGSGGATPSAVATAVWQDPLASSDFNTTGSAGAAFKGSLGSTGAALAPSQTTNITGNLSGSVGNVTNLAGMTLDMGTVMSSPAPTATTYSSNSPTLTATVSGAYIGSTHLFQSTTSLGRVHRVVTGHTVVAGSPNRHDFTVTTTTQTTPTVGPVATDTFVTL